MGLTHNDLMVAIISFSAILLCCVSPFIGVIVAYKLKGDGAVMAISGAVAGILGFMVTVIFVLWASQFVNNV